MKAPNVKPVTHDVDGRRFSARQSTVLTHMKQGLSDAAYANRGKKPLFDVEASKKRMKY